MTATEEKLDKLDIVKFKDLIENLTEKRLRIEKNYGYNIFKALKLEEDEIRLHSAFIADLLDPKGSHREGNIFLKLFLETVCKFNDINEKLGESVFVKTEVSIINIRDGKKERGRLDILIAGKSFIIVIENKIYAENQKNQLLKYHYYLEKQDPNSDKKLFYLNLFGEKASKKSTGGEEVDYEPISYREHILPWLEKCQKKCRKISVDVAIKQYHEIVKGVINQESAIIHIINEAKMDKFYLNADYLRTVKIIHQSFDKISKSIIDNVINEIDLKIKGEYPDYTINPGDEKKSDLKEYIRNMKVNDEFCIRFKYADTLLYGISSTDNNNPNFGIMKELIAKKLTEEFGNYFQEMKDGENTDFLFKKETAISFHRDKLCDNLKEDIEIIAEKCIRCIEILKKLPNPPIAESVKKIV